MDTITLRKSKIEFYDSSGNKIKPKDIENLLNGKNLTLDEKWFLRGCKHITERHYTEAIKRFQLSKSPDAKLMISVLAFKIADDFLFKEYLKLLNEEKLIYFPKIGFYPYFLLEDKKLPIDFKLIKKLLKLTNF